MTTLAITGATGKLGRATLKFLEARRMPAANILALARDPAKASDLAARGVQVRQGDYTDAGSLERAFNGADRLLFISTSALGEERMRHHRNVVDAAKRAGVKHILYTSVIKPAPDAKFAASPGHFATEALIRESGIPHTFFQNNLYMDLIPFLFAGAVESGTLVHSAGEGRVGFVPREDMAEAIAAALTSGKPPAKSYGFTVDRKAYSLADIAAALGKANGKTVRYKSVSSDEFRSVLESRGVPPAGVAMAIALGDAIRAGEFDATSPDLATLLGRPPVQLDEFLNRSS
jgi:NAD(P)H dehydrogenase (quinone)